MTIEQVFREYRAFVERSLRQLGFQRADAEDLTQEVFVVVQRKLAGFEGRSSLRTWLYGICLRVASDARKKAHRRCEVASPDWLHAKAGLEQVAYLERRQTLRSVSTALPGMHATKRDVLLLYATDDLSMAQIAQRVGCPLQTAFARLYAARRELSRVA